MIFPVVELENTVQVNDKTRLDGVKSYITPDESEITLIEIEPFNGAGYIDVTNTSYLDWQYDTDGVVDVTIRITTDGAPESVTNSITIVTSLEDALFSNDSQLTGHEPDVLQYVRAGRNSFLDVHRAAQDRILGWLDEHRIWDNNGARLTKSAIINVDEVADWSKFLTLQIIFEGLSNAIDDIFYEKSSRYRVLANNARARGALRLDFNGDGNQDANETSDVRSLRMHRR